MKYVIACLLIFGFVQTQAQDPISNIIQQGIKKVIIAMDLKIQRLQNKTIWLQNAQKTIENELSRLRLTEIGDWVEKQRKLYADYFDELWKVKSAIAYYHKVNDIIGKEKMILKENKAALSLFQGDPNFTRSEIAYMEKIYSGIMAESLNQLDAVSMVIHAFLTQMTDAKRMEIIDHAAAAIDQNLLHLREFTNGNKLIAMQRATEKGEVDLFKKIYGL
jgi:hypothetical protein